MSFSNLTLDISNIPSVQEVPLNPIAPNYINVMILRWIVSWVATLAIFFTSIYILKIINPGFIAITGSLVLLLIAILDLVTRWLSFKVMGYAVRGHDVVFKKGWFIQTLGTCPLRKIQHCKISSDVFERKFGLATLSFYTAGSAGADMKIHGLLKEDAEKIKDIVMTKLADYEV